MKSWNPINDCIIGYTRAGRLWIGARCSEGLVCFVADRLATSPHLVAGVLHLQHACRLSDDVVIARWVENPYYQNFAADTCFQHRPLIDPSPLTPSQRM